MASTPGRITPPSQAPYFATALGSLGSFVEESAVSVQLQAGPPRIRFKYAVTAGALPPGLTLSPTGRISGTLGTYPTSETYTFTITASSVAGPKSVSGEFTLTAVHTPEAPFWLTTGYLPTAQPGVAYSTTLEVFDETPPVVFSVISGSLPSGLTLNGSTGVISGTPSALAEDASYTFTVRATNNNPDPTKRTSTQTLKMVVKVNSEFNVGTYDTASDAIYWYSNAVAATFLTASTPVTVDQGAQLSINGGAWGTSGTLSQNDVIRIRYAFASPPAEVPMVVMGSIIKPVVFQSGWAVFRTAGSFTFKRPTGMPSIDGRLLLVGGGAAGGGSGSGTIGGGGGSGYVQTFTRTITSDQPVTVGNTGAGNGTSPFRGGTGGTTSFGADSVLGGEGGYGGIANGGGGNGGSGGGQGSYAGGSNGSNGSGVGRGGIGQGSFPNLAIFIRSSITAAAGGQVIYSGSGNSAGGGGGGVTFRGAQPQGPRGIGNSTYPGGFGGYGYGAGGGGTAGGDWPGATGINGLAYVEW